MYAKDIRCSANIIKTKMLNKTRNNRCKKIVIFEDNTVESVKKGTNVSENGKDDEV